MFKCLIAALTLFTSSLQATYPLQLDKTHDPHRKSWVESANDPQSDFPIQNLPFGVFRRAGTKEKGRIGVAIGDYIFDIKRAIGARILSDLGSKSRLALRDANLNAFMALDRRQWQETRRVLSDLLNDENLKLKNNHPLRKKLLVHKSEVEMLMPFDIGDYTDFYASIHHAKNVGSLFRPNNPLMPNYRHMPIGYHGRASSVVVSGTPVKRPLGQLKRPDQELPYFAPSEKLDYEVEVGIVIGKGNELGHPIPMASAPDHIFGIVIVNDWSARDVQKWEYQPLGPFNGKNFITSISPWVVTLDALTPYRIQANTRGDEDPPLLAYLQAKEPMGLNIHVEALFSSEKMRDRDIRPIKLSQTDFSEMYWNVAQLVTQHTVTGCNLKPGDLIATGTISGSKNASQGCLLEICSGGKHPFYLPDGSSRTFLQDGDEVTMRAYAQHKNGPRVGFGECCGVVTPVTDLVSDTE